ncbi:Unknown protein [Striga hermonthica]|uniref:Uncharacterized protein n=1 Tax=Striga hermonthica TaxID=68872 RepID=A0A9N7NTA3_STRHE|nr:Unknown protein [Striga hermonthica]
MRLYIADVADQAAKISVEEHMQCTTIQTLQKDLDSVKNETKKVMEENDQINKAKAQICLQILDKQKKTVSLESDSSTLSQTMELMRQEVLSLSGKLVDQRTHYKKVNEDISEQLKQQQEWVNAQNFGLETREGSCEITTFEAAQVKFDKIEQLRSNLVSENDKLRQSLEAVKNKMAEFKPELRGMGEKSLEEELHALLSDKAGEAEYLQTLQHQIMRLKEISHTVRCSCGWEYIVKLDV